MRLQPVYAAARKQMPLPSGSLCANERPSNMAQVLYDSDVGTTPSQQQWQFVTAPGAQASEHYSDGATLLDTFTQTGDLAGYFAVPSPTVSMRRDAGFVFTFTVQILAEAHNNQNRAGFSLIVLAEDARGIELGFWQDRVWAQGDGVHPINSPAPAPLFTQAEHVVLTTTQAITYQLRMLTDTYALLADGANVLSGPIRDYSAFNGFPDPYETPNLIFLGDDTTSARARVRLGRVVLQTCQRPALYLPLAWR